jgi:group I intron endonuclease
MFTIYLLTNTTTGKRYVGVTGNLPRRLCAHKHSGQPRTHSPQRYLSRSIRKHGWPAFTVTVLTTTNDRSLAWGELEQHYIRLYETNDPTKGYNLTDGGDGATGWVCSDATRQLMSAHHWTKRGFTHGMLGKHHTTTAKQAGGSKNAKYVWTCVSPNNVVYHTQTIGMFIDEHQLNKDAVNNFLGRPVPPARNAGVNIRSDRKHTTGWIFTRSPLDVSPTSPAIAPLEATTPSHTPH